MASTLPEQALNASRAALSAALADNEEKQSQDATPPSEQPLPSNGRGDEPGLDGDDQTDVQEVNMMEHQADEIRTVFSDPDRFNVKVLDDSSLFLH
jgi:translation initiation factor 4E